MEGSYTDLVPFTLQWTRDACVISWAHLLSEGGVRVLYGVSLGFKTSIWAVFWALQAEPQTRHIYCYKANKKNKPQNNPAAKSDSWFKVNLKLKLISSYMLLPMFLIGINEQNMYGMTAFILNEASGVLGAWTCMGCICAVEGVKQTDSLQASHLSIVPCLSAN